MPSFEIKKLCNNSHKETKKLCEILRKETKKLCNISRNVNPGSHGGATVTYRNFPICRSIDWHSDMCGIALSTCHEHFRTVRIRTAIPSVTFCQWHSVSDILSVTTCQSCQSAIILEFCCLAWNLYRVHVLAKFNRVVELTTTDYSWDFLIWF